MHDNDGVLLALDLPTGAVLWRHGRGLRPCAVVDGAVVAIRLVEPQRLTVVVLDSGDGTERWASPPVPLPAWTRQTLHDTPRFAVHCSASGREVLISWSARARYEGGAAPSQEVLEEGARDATGSLRLNLETLSLEALPPGASLEPDEASERAPRRLAISAEDVLDYSEVGPLRVELAVSTRAGLQDIVLRGVAPDRPDPMWEIVLDSTIDDGPPQLRP